MTRTAALSVFLLTALLPGVGAAAVDAQASRYYEDALSRYEKKDLDGAIIQLKNALQIDSGMLSGQLLLGRALLQNGQVAAAEVAFNEALRLGVNRAEVAPLLGQAYVEQGKQKLLFEQPSLRLEGLPDDARRQLLLLRAGASADLGDTREALKQIGEAKALDPLAAEAWLAEARIHIRAQQRDLARTAAERALALAPRSAQAWSGKAAVHHAFGQLKEALSAYDRAIQIDSQHSEALIARAGILVDQGRIGEAARDLATLRTLSPKEPRAAYLRALLAERNKALEEARKALLEVTTLIDPVPMDFIRYRPQLLMLNGLAHQGLGESEKARKYLEAFQKAQDATPVARLLAKIYLDEGRPDRAIELLEAYLKAQPADGQAMVLLGNALIEKGQHGRAVSLMKQALQTRDAPEFRTVLGMTLIRGGQTAEGLAELETAWRKDALQLQAGATLAATYLQLRQSDKAVKAAEGLVAAQPASAPFHNLLGMARAQSGQLAAARSSFEQALRLDAAFLPPQLNLARLDISEKAFAVAEQRLNGILKTHARNAEAHFETGILAERRGQFADAERWLKKAVDLSGPKEVRWVLALMDYQMRRAQPVAALEAAKLAASKLPDDLAALLPLARLQLVNGDAKGAQGTLTKLTRLAGYDPASQLQIALLQMQANNLSGAAYSLDKALSGEADFLAAQALMAEVELKMGAADKAEKRAQGIVAKHPKRAIGHSLIGDIATSRGQPAAALDAYRKAHQVEPSTDTLLRLFNAHEKVGAGETAQSLAEQWLKAHPKDVAVMRRAADGHARAGHFAAARKAYEGVLKLNPDDAATMNNLANVLLKLKDPGATRMAEQAVAKNPGDPLAIDTLGWCLFQSGETDRALQLLRDARLRAPATPDIRYHLGAALAKVGRTQEAVDELSAALANNQRFEEAETARKLLESLR